MAIILGIRRAFQLPIQQSLTPSLIPRHLLQNAIAFSSSRMNIAIIVGPTIGGFLYLLSPEVVYSICMALISSLLLSTLINHSLKNNNGNIRLKPMLAG